MATVLPVAGALFAAFLLVAALLGYVLGLTREPPGPDPQSGSTATPTAAEYPDIFAGRTEGETATLAILTGDGEAVAYVRGGDDFEAWLDGPVEGNRMELSGPDGAGLRGTVEDGLVAGDITTPRFSTAFVATAASDLDLDDLGFRRNGTEYRATPFRP